MPGQPRPPRRLLFVALATVSLVALGDWLLFDRPLGWSVGLFTLALLLCVLACGAGRRIVTTRSGGAAELVAGIVALAATMVLEPRVVAVLLAAAALWTLALWSRQGSSVAAPVWLRRMAALPLALATRPVGDLVAVGRINGRRQGAMRGFVRAPLVWIAPLAFTAVFLGLFAIANPVLDRAVRRSLETIGDLLSNLAESVDVARVACWGLFAALAWVLMRARAKRVRGPGRGRRRGHDDAPEPGAALRLDPPPPALHPPAGSHARSFRAQPRQGGPAFAWRCLLLFNAAFAVQTALDVAYLVGGATLPAGMTYASYAHRGAYPLIAAALLAGLFTLAVFRPGLDAQAMRPARRLLVPWIAQSIFLTATAAWRLWLYVDMFGLTRWRVAAAIWMGLVAAGLLLVVLQVLLRRDGEWLLRRTLAATIATLALCCVPDWEGIIAWHNVRHCREVGADAVPIDLRYLESLGPATLPALAWLEVRGKGLPIASELDGVSSRLRERLAGQLADWRGWTIRRAWLRAPDGERGTIAPRGSSRMSPATGRSRTPARAVAISTPASCRRH